MRSAVYAVPVGLLFLAAAAQGADPVVVELPEQAAAKTVLVTFVGDVARVTGGDAATRDRVAGLDLAEFKPRDQSVTVARQGVEYRIQLAGIDPAAVRVTGAERTTVAVARRTVSHDEVVTAARWELVKHLGVPGDAVAVELALPIAVKMPEVPAGERVVIAAQPHGRVTGPGRAQMDVSISAGGERLLSLAVMLDVRPKSAVAPAGGPLPAGPVAPAGGAGRPAAPGAGEVMVRARQRVRVQVVSAGFTVTVVGEAQQDGRLGQNILVQNIDSKKVLTARVSGPGVVDVELGGGP